MLQNISLKTLHKEGEKNTGIVKDLNIEENWLMKIIMVL